MKSIEEIVSNWQPIWAWKNTGLRENTKPYYELLVRSLDSLDEVNKDKAPFKQILRSDKPKKLYQVKIKNWRIAQKHLINFCDSKADIIKTYNVLTWICKAGQTKGCWKFSSDPGYMDSKKQESPSFSPPIFSHISQLEKIQYTLKNIQNNQLSDDALLGRLTLDLILHANCISPSVVFAFVSSLPDLKIVEARGLLWTDIHASWSGRDNQELRRLLLPSVILAIVSEIQLRKNRGSEFWDYHPEKMKSMTSSRERTAFLWKMSNSFLKAANCKITKQINSLKKLTDIQHAYLDTSMPAIAAKYSRQDFVSHSMKPSCWSRIWSIETFEHIFIEKQLKTRIPKEPNQIDNPDLSEFYHCLHPKLSRLKATDQLNTWLNERQNLTPIWKLLVQWFIDLLTKASGHGSKSSVKSIRKIAYWVVPGLVEYAGLDDVLKYELNEWIELYHLIVEEKDKKTYRTQIAKELYQFHQFMHQKGYAEFFSEGELGFQNTLVEVDANIISFDEYERCRNLIINESDPRVSPAFKTILLLLLALGFYCGLRRREALYIKLCDLIGFSTVTLQIIPNHIRGLKTTSSKRKLPLERMLPQRELAELHNWLKIRRDEDYGESIGFAFAIPQEDHQLLREDEVFKPLHVYLRAATGDITIRYHHLRHSFATWSALRITAPYQLDVLFDETILPLTHQAMTEANQWYQTLRNHDQPTRSGLFLIARLLGHSTPKITLEHYIHCMDLVLYLYSLKIIESKQHVISKHNMPRSTQYHNMLESKDLRPKYTIKNYNKLIIQLNAINIKIPVVKNNFKKKSLFERYWIALYQSIVFNRSLNHLSREIALTVDEILNLKFISKTLFSDLSINQKLRRERSKKNNKNDFSIPAIPRKSTDLQIFRELEPKLLLLKKNEKKDLLSIYFDHVRINSEDIVFKQAEKLSRLFEIIEQIGIKKKQLNIRLQSTKKETKRKSVRYWRKEGNIHKDVKISSKSAPGNRGEHGWLLIKVIFQTDGSSSPAFRYLITMLLIHCRHRDRGNEINYK